MPVTVARFTGPPAWMSAWMTVRVPMQIVEPPGASVVTTQVTPVVWGR